MVRPCRSYEQLWKVVFDNLWVLLKEVTYLCNIGRMSCTISARVSSLRRKIRSLGLKVVGSATLGHIKVFIRSCSGVGSSDAAVPESMA